MEGEGSVEYSSGEGKERRRCEGRVRERKGLNGKRE